MNNDESKYTQLLDEFIVSMRYEKNASEHSVRAYKSDLTRFVKWMDDNDIDLATATRRNLRAYVASMVEDGYAQTSIARNVSAIRMFYRWLILQEVCEGNPAEEIGSGKKTRSMPHVLRTEEVEALLSVCSAKDKQGNPRKQSPSDMRTQALLEFLYASGCRISEASNLLVENIDFGSGTAKVMGKGSKERVIMLHQTALKAMRDYFDQARGELLGENDNDHFFISNTGLALSADSMRAIFKKTVAAAGLPKSITPHTMRHTFATDMLSGGADLRTVQELLGHAGLSTTQIYTHLDATRILEAHRLSHPRG